MPGIVRNPRPRSNETSAATPALRHVDVRPAFLHNPSVGMTETITVGQGGDTDRTENILRRGHSVLRREAEAILDADARLDNAFVKAVEMILDSTGRVGVTGMGKAGLIGNKIQATLASTGTLSYRIHPVEALHGDLGMIHADDVILALSKSGGSELAGLLPVLCGQGCRIILLTARLDSMCARHADVVLDIGQTPEACPLGLAPSSSGAAMLALGDALALTVMEVRRFTPEQYARNHPGGALGRLLMRAREVMRTGPNCPIVPEAATLEDCYRAILAAPKRAGAACVVDPAGRLVGIVTHGDFFRLLSRAEPLSALKVADVMTRNPKRVGEDEPAVEALRIMQQYAIDDLPVVDAADGATGLIDIQDLIARGFVT
ncbi:MAG: KpsF/GutQ family sugar-phosphate isomerase [Phycisphaerae bacterium]|nr:KpsF/GutQ family sugar-phosphate isomerase [Phycisphaerae bacterium]